MPDIDVEELRQQVIDTIDMTRDMDDEEIKEIIDRVIRGTSDYKLLHIMDRCRLHQDIYYSIKGLGVLERYISDSEVTEIMINGTRSIFIEKNGRIIETGDRFESESRLNDVIQQIVSRTNKRVNETNPIADTRLEDGSRVNIVMPPVALDGAVVTIRKFPEKQIIMEDLIKWGTITAEAAEFLKNMVAARYNIFISGGTSSGKTTFLNVLSNFIPVDERVIVIEDSAELQIRNVNNLVRMESRPANAEGKNEITIRSLIKSSLRMRPDRIIVGEVRGEEVVDMLGAAMNTGHDGSMSTGHANSASDMLSRLETMMIMGIDIPLPAVRAQIGSALDIIVHLGRMRDRKRRVLEISEVLGADASGIKLSPIYKFVEDADTTTKDNVSGSLVATGSKLIHREKLISSGLASGIR